jgi:hypothetical protein
MTRVDACCSQVACERVSALAAVDTRAAAAMLAANTNLRMEEAPGTGWFCSRCVKWPDRLKVPYYFDIYLPNSKNEKYQSNLTS